MIPTRRILSLLLAIFTLSLVVPTMLTASSATPSPATPTQSTSDTISSSIFFTDPSLTSLPLDLNRNPMVNTTIGTAQTCTGYTSKGHHCEGAQTWFVVQHTYPDQVRAWINITRVSGPAVRAIRLNETLPLDWAVNPSWGIRGTGGIHAYFANTTRLATNPEFTQYSTITVSGNAPQIAHIAIPDFNKTAIRHPLFPGQSILLSVTMTYSQVGKDQGSVISPKTYTDTMALAAWNHTSFTGTETVTSASASFLVYGRAPLIVSPTSDLGTNVLNIGAQLIFPLIIVAIILVVMGYLARAKRKPDFPESRPLAA